MLTREQWERLKPIVASALELAPDEASAYLDGACAGAPDLRTEAERLLRAIRMAGRSLAILESPAADFAGSLVRLPDDPSGGEVEMAPGVRIGSYTIERRLGTGGMGIVYLAHDARLQRHVALKLLPAWLRATDGANLRFEREARAASRLDHPNVETVYEIGDTPDGRRFIAIAYYEGETLQQRIARGPLPLHEAIDLARQIADGLAATHAQGIIHRDIKPSNVIVTPDGVAKIVDFGTAIVADSLLTVSGATHGTIAYMSPEQTLGAAVDGRTDLWSLGVVLYEMLTGTRPFAGHRADSVIFAIRHDEPVPVERARAGVPEALVRIVRRCLAKNPDERYRAATEVRDDLARLANVPVDGRWRRRTVRATAAAAVLLLAGTGGILVQANGTKPIGVPAPANIIAVLPPLPVGDDTALARLGRELAVTLSASLDGMGGIRTIPAVSVLAQTGERALPLQEAARIAGDLSATSLLNGTLVRSGRLVRLEMALYASSDLEAITRVSVTTAIDDLTALSDSAAIAVLRRIWSHPPSPVPSVAGITTRSVPALRAYLDGELAFARADYIRAVPAFRRAFAADSTFLLAYWRSLYPAVYEGSRPDSAIVSRIIAERHRLPDPDRMLVEAYAASTLSERLTILRNVTTRFPEYWPGWYDYANVLVHDGPFVGTTYADARVALERVVALNTNFPSAWVHLHWIASLQRDTIAVNRTIEALERFVTPDAAQVNPENLMWGYAFQELFRSRGDFQSDIPTKMAATARRPQLRDVPEDLANRFLQYGFAKAQIQRADAVLRERTPPGVAAAQWGAKAYAWAARGAWDSAFAAAAHWVRLSDDRRTPLRAYGLAVLGVTTGAVQIEEARRWRPRRPGGAGSPAADDIAEVAWLDGVLAYAAGDAGTIARAEHMIQESGAQFTQVLSKSLQMLHRRGTGDRSAARALVEFELDTVDRARAVGAVDHHPHFFAIHRPAAARLALATGDTVEAVRLLRWHEAILRSSATAASRIVEPLALYERARLEEALGRVEAAGEHYAAFLERYDLPPSKHRALVADARAALERLTRSAM